MPIEIRELVIKTTVSNNNENHTENNVQGGNSEAMINEIVDKVFRIIQEKSER